MKAIFWIGLVVLILGLASLVVPIPSTDHDSASIGGVSIGIETQHEEKLPPMVGAIMILAGAGMMLAGKSSIR